MLRSCFAAVTPRLTFCISWFLPASPREERRKGHTTLPAALAFRRIAFIAAPVAAALLIVAGFFLDPAIDKSGIEMAEQYAAHPDREQVSANAFRLAYALLAVPVVVLIVSVRARGVWLANLAGVAAVLGMTTLPGFLVTDFFDIAIYGELGPDAWQTVNDRLEEMPGAIGMFLTGFLGFVVALPLALLGAWRAGLLPWWLAPLLFAGVASTAVLPGGFGLLVWAATLAFLSYALLTLWRGADSVDSHRETASETAP